MKIFDLSINQFIGILNLGCYVQTFVQFIISINVDIDLRQLSFLRFYIAVSLDNVILVYLFSLLFIHSLRDVGSIITRLRISSP